MWIYADWLFLFCIVLPVAAALVAIGYEWGRTSRPNHGGGGGYGDTDPIVPDHVPDEWVDETV